MQQAFAESLGVHEMLGDALDQMPSLAESLRAAVTPLAEQRTRLRSTLSDLGAIKALPDDGAYISLTAVDGAFATSELFIGDQVNVLALAVSSDLGTGSVGIEGYKTVNEFFTHSPASETYAKGVMLGSEMILAADAATRSDESVTVLDGSHSTGLLAVLESLVVEGSPAHEYMCGDVMSDQIVSALTTVARSESVVACPKSDSSTALADLLGQHGVKVSLQFPDKVLASLLLEPGEVLTLESSTAPWDRVDVVSHQITSLQGSALRDRVLEACEPLRRGLRIAHVKPRGSSTAVRVETKSHLDDFETMDYWQAIADDCAPPYTQEPVAQYIADHLAKNVSELSKVQLDSAHLDLAEGADDTLREFLIRSYRTT